MGIFIAPSLGAEHRAMAAILVRYLIAPR